MDSRERYDFTEAIKGLGCTVSISDRTTADGTEVTEAFVTMMVTIQINLNETPEPLEAVRRALTAETTRHLEGAPPLTP